MAHAVLIMKVTRRCNLRCAYCRDRISDSLAMMSFATLSSAIASGLRAQTTELVVFIWHGGEPTLIPISFYEKAILVQSRFIRPGQHVRNNFQTNGTILTKEWVRFFKANNFFVGLSLDGPPQVHNRYRRNSVNRGSYDDVLRGIRFLDDQKVPYAVLAVVDEATIQLGADRLFEFFLEQGVRNFALNAVLPCFEPKKKNVLAEIHYIEPERMNSFFCRLYDLWLENGDPDIHIREIEAIRNRLLGKGHNLCTLTGNCHGYYFMIEPNGDVKHCDQDGNEVLGNVQLHDFEALKQSAGLIKMKRKANRLRNLMRKCDEYNVCNGWCPHQVAISKRYNTNYRNDCCGLRDLIQHIRRCMVENGELDESTETLNIESGH